MATITPQTFLSSRGYAILKSSIPEELINEIKDDLTMSPNVNFSIGSNIAPITFPCYLESQKKIYIPKAYGLKNYGIPLEDNLDKGESINLEFKGTLRDYQIEPVDKLLKSCLEPKTKGGILSLLCGQGKTSCSLYVLTKLGKKAMVILHKNFLIDQWRERIEQFIPDARVGLIKAKIIDVENKDIILCSLQSLAMKDYDPEIFKGIGTMIVDECHRTGPEIFSRAYFRLTPVYSIGLSATIQRKDGMSKVFKNHIGDVIYKSAKSKDNNVDIDIINFIDDNEEYCKIVNMYNGKPIIPSMTTNIGNYMPRIFFLVDIIEKILLDEPRRNILILSDRINHLKLLKKEIDSRNMKATTGFYIGGMKEKQLKETEENCNIILASFSIASEGLDLEKLDTLIFATSKSDIQQSVGRILRKRPEARDYNPLIIDIVDNFSIFPNQAKKRLAYYKKNKYNIINKNTEPQKEHIETIYKQDKYIFIKDN
jgi:superfamily II DNA or RNA helicase